jgi:hypothetical protein
MAVAVAVAVDAVEAAAAAVVVVVERHVWSLSSHLFERLHTGDQNMQTIGQL